jgi:hypothetical protein
VISPCVERGPSPKRVESALQPAAPIEMIVSAIARGHERDNSTNEFMSCPLKRNNNAVS